MHLELAIYSLLHLTTLNTTVLIIIGNQVIQRQTERNKDKEKSKI